jgi:antitoxin VapB
MMYIMDIYQRANGFRMTETATAKLFMHGRSQAVRLPKEFRLPGKEVSVRRVGRGVLLEPLDDRFDVAAWWAKLDEYLDVPFMPEGREQPPMPIDSREYFDE